MAPRNNLALLLTVEGRVREALFQYRSAIELDPLDPAAPSNLAWLLATSRDSSIRNGGEAFKLANDAIKLTNGNDPTAFDSLAAAYAENGQFEEAIAAAELPR